MTKSWGPDRFPESGVLLLAKVGSCTAVTQPDGSLQIDIQGQVAALTAPLFISSRVTGWRITPDGQVMHFG